MVARTFDLVSLLGASVGLAAVSFVAYVLGALVTVPADRLLVRLFVDRQPRGWTPPPIGKLRQWSSFASAPGDRLRWVSREAALTNAAYTLWLGRQTEPMWRTLRLATDRGQLEESAMIQLALDNALDRHEYDLRIQLLVGNQQLFDECDRLGAEAKFRLNLVPALLTLVGTAAVDLHAYWVVPLGLLACSMLAYQSLVRAFNANAVLQRAVMENVIPHPIKQIESRLLSSDLHYQSRDT